MTRFDVGANSLAQLNSRAYTVIAQIFTFTISANLKQVQQ